MNNVFEDIRSMIGNTPILKINHMGVKPGVNIYAKLELMNPAGSVKDRVGVYMIDDAKKRGILKEGGTIIDATAGNTGIGIAVAALNQGIRVIFTVPEKFSIEKQQVMRALGAEIIHTSREEGMLGAERKAEELLKQIEGSISLRQFRNPANPLADNRERFRRTLSTWEESRIFCASDSCNSCQQDMLRNRSFLRGA